MVLFDWVFLLCGKDGWLMLMFDCDIGDVDLVVVVYWCDYYDIVYCL